MHNGTYRSQNKIKKIKKYSLRLCNMTLLIVRTLNILIHQQQYTYSLEMEILAVDTFPTVQQPLVGQGLLIIEDSRSHSGT